MHRSFSRSILLSSLFALLLAACAPAAVLPIPESPLMAVTPTTLIFPALQPLSTSLPTRTASLLPSATPPRSSCGIGYGSIVSGVISTNLLDKPMRYNVYLPPCYGIDPYQRYPVLYLLHGQNFAEDQWIRIGAAAAANKLIWNREAPPFIMVFPFDYSYKQPTEYKFEEVFIDQLVPTIDENFKTRPQAKYRSIGGLSRGGAWALHIGAGHPDLFGSVGGHSPSIFVLDEKPLRRSLLALPVFQQPRLWLDVGDKDSEYALIARFEEFLSENNLPHEFHTYVGWHDEKYWSAHVEDYLRWYAQGW